MLSELLFVVYTASTSPGREYNVHPGVFIMRCADCGGGCGGIIRQSAGVWRGRARRWVAAPPGNCWRRQRMDVVDSGRLTAPAHQSRANRRRDVTRTSVHRRDNGIRYAVVTKDSRATVRLRCIKWESLGSRAAVEWQSRHSCNHCLMPLFAFCD